MAPTQIGPVRGHEKRPVQSVAVRVACLSMKAAELVDSPDFAQRVEGALAALGLSERESILIENDDEARLLAVAADYALVLFRQKRLPMAGSGGFALDVELHPWTGVRGFTAQVTALAGETKEETDVSISSLSFEAPQLTVEPRSRHHESMPGFVAAVLERISAHA